MSKYKSVIIAFIFTIVGCIGVLISSIPSVSKEYKIIDKFIKATNQCNVEKMKNCLPKEILDIDLIGDIFDKGIEKSDSKLDFLDKTNLSIYSRIPSNAKELKNLALVSINENSDADTDTGSLELKATVYVATIKVTYVDAGGKTQSFTSKSPFLVCKTSKGYKVIPD